MSDWKAKRFWTDVTVEQAGGGFEIRLDGRPVKTPAKTPITVPSRALAEAMAIEWRAVEGEIRPADMPMTRSANAAIDKVAVQFADVADMLAAYGASDLLCYRADGPEELISRQAKAWDPLLEWAEQTYGAKLNSTRGIMPVGQDADAVERLRRAVHDHSAFELTALHDLIAITGSLILGLAVTRGHIDADSAWSLSRMDEDWQIEQWGPDDEATEAAEVKRQALMHAERLYAMVCKTSAG